MHSKPKTCFIRDKLLEIKNSIWYSTEQGMVEYCLNSNTVKQVVKYQEHYNIQPEYHCLCAFKDTIYIIDGYNCEIIAFNPSLKIFTHKIKIDFTGYYSSAIVINDEIRIYNGGENNRLFAYIYCPNTNTVRKMYDRFASQHISNVCLINYHNQLIRFGGYNLSTQSTMDWFLMSTNVIDVVFGYIHWMESLLNLPEIASDVTYVILRHYCWKEKDDNFKWEKIHDFTLEKPMRGCGYVIYKHYIITFGGNIAYDEYIDNIYILDMRDEEKGWIESKMKCPKKSEYRGILTSNGDIHLFQAGNKKYESGHYSIHSSFILEDIDNHSD